MIRNNPARNLTLTRPRQSDPTAMPMWALVLILSAGILAMWALGYFGVMGGL